MTSSDERREVAERLRKQLMYMRKNNSYDEDANVVDCGNSAYRNIAWSVEPYDNFEKGNYVHIVERLADLIDPTCHKVIPSEIEGYVFCSKCGAEIGEYGVPNYCHNCGARVVSGDDE